MAYTKYSLTPANNNATPPDGAPEGMLPSAVNDTMRDMMAQIRDCGDGIRDGTYTMTAPKITGGTITGSTINNSAIGGTTAAAGKFTTLEATGVTTVQAGTASAPAITTSGDTNTGILFPAADTIAATTGGTERMRIDSSGNVSMGRTATSGGERLGVTTSNALVIDMDSTAANGGYMRYTASGTVYGYIGTATGIIGSGGTNALAVRSENAMMFATGGSTERMRILSGGGLMIGQTSQNGAEILGVTGNISGTEIVRFYASHATNPYGMAVVYPNANPNGTANEFLVCVSTGSVIRMSVRSNGGIANYSANNVNLSDAREKTNIELAGSYLDKICSIPVKTFNYIDQNLEEDGGLTLGVIAQDVQAVAPELVMESNWAGKDEPEKMRLSIYQTDLQYALMKCIQEQQAIINDLQTRITQLENK